MSPAPTTTHQRMLGFLYREISTYLKGKVCEAFPSPFDVFLVDEGQDMKDCNKIVQPDIAVICDKDKINDKGCIGTPDFIVEITSKYNKAHDYITKLNLYNANKVREYWIVNPENKTIITYVLELENDNFSAPVAYTFNDKVKSSIFEALEIDFNELIL